MTEFINKIKGIKGIGYIAAGLVIALVLLLMPHDSGENTAQTPTEEEYRAELQAEVTELIKSLTGIKNVCVGITLGSGYEYTYAADKYVTERTSDGDTETREAKSEIFAGSDGNAVLIKQKPPAVSGVAVVCRGADSAQKLQIISLLTALFDIGSNRISVQT